MKTGSLRFRLLAVSAITVALAVAIAGVGIVVLFERHVERRIGAELDTYLTRMAAKTVFDGRGDPGLGDVFGDPRFGKVFGGLYWQITDEKTGRQARSRSLWDTTLALPDDMPDLGAVHVHDIDGPQGARLRVHERRLSFSSPQGKRILRLAVAVDRADIDALTNDFARDMAISLALLFVVLTGAAWFQANVGLQPLQAIRNGLAGIRSGRVERLEGKVPREIAPLVEEVNQLLDDQSKSVQRARSRAADLAHGLKTPLTALMADARRLREAGRVDIAEEIERTATIMSGHVEREMTRSRLGNSRISVPVAVHPVIRGLVDTLKRTPRGEVVTFEVVAEKAATTRIDSDDLREAIGNLLENAVRHAAGRVRVSVTEGGGHVCFEVDDDGLGLSEAEIAIVSRRGERLDSAPLGAGLGLAIVQDILEHYGAALNLGRSDLGGLKASFRVSC